MSELTEALPGIWFWEAPHPDWSPGEGWDEFVRCWAIKTDAGLLLVDPLIREDLEPEAAWAALDRLVEQRGPVKAVVRTLHFHHRSAPQASARYDVPIYAREPPRPGITAHPYDVAISDGGHLPGGLLARHLQRDDEIALWIPDSRALLFSDVGLRRAERFELCPDWWLKEDDSWGILRDQLIELAELEPEHLLVCHGSHALGDGAELVGAVDRAAARPLMPFIELDELALRRTSWKLVDARMYLDGRSARAAYDAAHVPGAIFLDFEATLSDPPGPAALRGRHPLPTPETFAAGLAAAGISDGDTVVAYDDAGGVIAARLVWMLRVLGEDAALLSPVPDHWESTPVDPPAPGHFTPRPWPSERLADIEDVANRGPDTVLLDARDPERFRGGPDPLEPRSGHIPGAVNLPCRANVEPGGTLADAATLSERFSAAGIAADTDVISSCGSGVTACHNLLVLEQLHLGRGRLYVGSFSQWSRDPARAIETGTPPGPASR